MSSYSEPDYKELKAKFLAIQEGVNNAENAESEYEMYRYATTIFPQFCKEMLKVVLSQENALGGEFGCTVEAVRGIEDDEFLNS